MSQGDASLHPVDHAREFERAAEETLEVSPGLPTYAVGGRSDLPQGLPQDGDLEPHAQRRSAGDLADSADGSQSRLTADLRSRRRVALRLASSSKLSSS